MPRQPSKPKPAAAASSPAPGAEPPDDATLAIRDAIRAHVPEAIRELARLAHEAASEQARVSAINALIDRGYGNLKHATRETTAPMASRSASSRPPTEREIALPEAFRPLFVPSRYKAFYGGRGSGKSHAVATALVLMAAERPLRILAAREIQRSIRDSSKRLLDDRIAALGL